MRGWDSAVLELSGRVGSQEGAALFPANNIKNVHVSAPTGGRGPVITCNYCPSGLIGGFVA